ncbi:MAG: serine protease [Candidatus Poribacteria bacterium]|nr:serine protease [Candidatus Poribacteria bacterium]
MKNILTKIGYMAFGGLLIFPIYFGGITVLAQSVERVEIPLATGTVELEPRRLSVDEIYDKTIQSLVWIVSAVNQDNSVSQGSGVLIDRELRLAVTNHHVVKDNDEVAVFFPVRDRHGVLIDERSFYINESNLGALTRIGYAVAGRVIAKDHKTDLAIIQLEGLPVTAIEIHHAYESPIRNYLNKNPNVQIFGNPGGLKLWKWAAGFFQNVDQGMIKINAGTYKGNSGGPVVNDQGMLIGLATLSNERHTTWAVPAIKIKALLDTLKPIRVFSLSNDTPFTIHYEIAWFPGNWRQVSLGSDYNATHWYPDLKEPDRYSNILSVPDASNSIPEGYPKVRFDHIANDEKITYKIKPIQTYIRALGYGVEPDEKKDAREYHFGYNFLTEKLDLHDSEKK